MCRITPALPLAISGFQLIPSVTNHLTAVAFGHTLRVLQHFGRNSDEATVITSKDVQLSPHLQFPHTAEALKNPQLGRLMAGPKAEIATCTRKCLPACVRGGEGGRASLRGHHSESWLGSGRLDYMQT